MITIKVHRIGFVMMFMGMTLIAFSYFLYIEFNIHHYISICAGSAMVLFPFPYNIFKVVATYLVFWDMIFCYWVLHPNFNVNYLYYLLTSIMALCFAIQLFRLIQTRRLELF
jgi:hypothetical protein